MLLQAGNSARLSLQVSVEMKKELAEGMRMRWQELIRPRQSRQQTSDLLAELGLEDLGNPSNVSKKRSNPYQQARRRNMGAKERTKVIPPGTSWDNKGCKC